MPRWIVEASDCMSWTSSRKVWLFRRSSSSSLAITRCASSTSRRAKASSDSRTISEASSTMRGMSPSFMRGCLLRKTLVSAMFTA